MVRDVYLILLKSRGSIIRFCHLHIKIFDSDPNFLFIHLGIFDYATSRRKNDSPRSVRTCVYKNLKLVYV